LASFTTEFSAELVQSPIILVDNALDHASTITTIEFQLVDLQKLESCLLAVESWLTENKLLPSANKSDAMLIGTSAQLHTANIISCITMAGATLKPTAKLKSL
jgi:hypothetical protein